MRSSLVGLQLLLSCTLLLGLPGSRGEQNSTWEEPEEGEERSDKRLPDSSLESFEPEIEYRVTSEELEERAESNRQAMKMEGSLGYQSYFLKRAAMKHFNEESHGPFYREIEDTNIKVKEAIGTMIHFSMFLVDTNCTKQEGQKSFGFDHYSYMDSLEEDFSPRQPVLCVAAPKHQRRPIKCNFQVFIDGRTGLSSVVNHFCNQVIIPGDVEVEETSASTSTSTSAE